MFFLGVLNLVLIKCPDVSAERTATVFRVTGLLRANTEAMGWEIMQSNSARTSCKGQRILCRYNRAFL